MKYTLTLYKLNLNTSKYEQEKTITCDDEKEVSERLLALYKDRDFKPSTRKYKFKYTKESINITCEFLERINFDTVELCAYKYTYKHEYKFIY